jgi:hypothetical protein
MASELFDTSDRPLCQIRRVFIDLLDDRRLRFADLVQAIEDRTAFSATEFDHRQTGRASVCNCARGKTWLDFGYLHFQLLIFGAAKSSDSRS